MWIFSVAAAASIDELGGTSEKVGATMRRAFPLFEDAVPWDSIRWHNYSKIIVSGPQRSGTTFFAAALSKALGYTHVDEMERLVLEQRDGTPLHVRMNTKLRDFLKADANLVLQRPMWSAMLHKLVASPHVFVAFLARNCLDVFRSQNRIMSTDLADTGWTCKYGRTTEWNHYHSDPDLRSIIEDEHDMICTIKQQAYRDYQRQVMDDRGIHSAPIAYSSFHTLGAYVNTSKRDRHLKPKQIAKAAAAAAANDTTPTTRADEPCA